MEASLGLASPVATTPNDLMPTRLCRNTRSISARVPSTGVTTAEGRTSKRMSPDTTCLGLPGRRALRGGLHPPYGPTRHSNWGGSPMAGSPMERLGTDLQDGRPSRDRLNEVLDRKSAQLSKQQSNAVDLQRSSHPHTSIWL